MVKNITALERLDQKELLWYGMAPRKKSIALNMTADLYIEVLLWIGLAQEGKAMVQSTSMLWSDLIPKKSALDLYDY